MKEFPVNELVVGDSIKVMRTFPSNSIDMVMFSPPYWGLRDYGVKGQIGLESHPNQYIDKIVSLCREVKRVLKKSGSMYLNMGDTYCSIGSSKREDRFSWPSITVKKPQGRGRIQRNYLSNWLRPKQLLLIPSRVAIALQNDESGDFYRLKKKFINLEVLTITDNNALQRPRETESLLQRICKTLERETQRPVSKTDEGMARKEPGKNSSIFSEALLDSSGTRNNKSNEVQCKEISQIETSSSHSLRRQSSEVCVLRGISFIILNNTPYVGIWEQTSPRDKKIWQYLRMVETCELSRRISSVMHELQLCNREIRNLSTSRGRDFWIRKCNIPKELEECFELAKEEPWVLRNDIVWFKPNHMPSSVRDRLTQTYEHIFFFVKQRKYYYDLDAIKEPHKLSTIKRVTQKTVFQQKGGPKQVEFRKMKEGLGGGDIKTPAKIVKRLARKYVKHDLAVNRVSKFSYADPLHIKAYNAKRKNPGDVIATFSQGLRIIYKRMSGVDASYQSKFKNNEYGQTLQSFTREEKIAKMGKASRKVAKELFPNNPRLQQDFINWVHDHAGSPKGRNPGDFWSISTKPFKGAHFAVYPEEICVKPILSSCPPDGIVLDPMCGSGTTLVVAHKLGRRWIGIDLKPKYIEMARRRLERVGAFSKKLDNYLRGINSIDSRRSSFEETRR